MAVHGNAGSIACSESKLAQLQKFLEEQEAELEVTLKKAEALKGRIRQTKLECARMHNLVAPVLGLPSEIACIIFKFARGPSIFIDRRKDGVYRAEIKISHVCKLWRSIAIAYSDLWSTFTCCVRQSVPGYDYNVKDEVADSVAFHLLSLYLERSRNQPLDVCISQKDTSIDFNIIISIMEQLVRHVSRWRRMSFSFHGRYINRLISRLEHVAAPNLEAFELQVPSDMPFHPLFRGGAPKLTHLRVDYRIFKKFIPSTSLLTTLQIKRDNSAAATLLPWTTFLDLVASPTLANFFIAGNIFASPTKLYAHRKSGAMITTRLKRLQCGDATVAEYMWLFLKGDHLDHLTFILVDTWQFPFEEETISQPASALGPGSFPSLRTLVLLDCGRYTIQPTHSLLLAHATRSVVHLMIGHTRGDTMFENMVGFCPETILWPHLETLTCDIEEWDGVEPAEFKGYLKVVECRTKNLKRHCVLRLPSDKSCLWETENKKSWKRLQSGGYLEIIPDRSFLFERDSDSFFQ